MSRTLALLFAGALAACASPSAPQTATVGCRDGVPHGKYVRRVENGATLLEGTFVHGQKHGVFQVFSTRGVKTAEIPYQHDRVEGTFRTWYEIFPLPDSARRIQATTDYVGGVASGSRRTWWLFAVERSREQFEDGVLINARAWDQSGRLLSSRKAAELAVEGVGAEAKLFDTLAAEIAENLPDCK